MVSVTINRVEIYILVDSGCRKIIIHESSRELLKTKTRGEVIYVVRGHKARIKNPLMSPQVRKTLRHW